MSSHHDEDEQQQRQRQQQQRPKIVEDGPVMRSVAMMPSMAAPMIPLRSFPSLFHKPPPPPPSSQRQNEASLEPHSLDNNVAPPVVVVAPWKVSKALAIPSYYKMERTHIYVPDASPLAVSERIADCFFKESIAATFDDKQVCFVCRLLETEKNSTLFQRRSNMASPPPFST